MRDVVVAIVLLVLGAALCVFVLLDMGGEAVPNPAMGEQTVVKIHA